MRLTSRRGLQGNSRYQIAKLAGNAEWPTIVCLRGFGIPVGSPIDSEYN